MKVCQNPQCHLYNTTDRLRGSKGKNIIKVEEQVSSIMVMVISVHSNVKMIFGECMQIE